MTGQDGSVVYNGTPHNHTPIYASKGKANYIVRQGVHRVAAAADW